MWNNKNLNLELLSELATIELEPIKKCYVLKKSIGKVSLISLDNEQFYNIFSLSSSLKEGTLSFKVDPSDFENIIVSINYWCYLSERTITSNNFSKLYSDIKEDIVLSQSVYSKYIDFLKKIASKIPYSKSKSSQSSNWDFSKFTSPAEDIINNIKPIDKKEEDEN